MDPKTTRQDLMVAPKGIPDGGGARSDLATKLTACDEVPFGLILHRRPSGGA
jgi:hypothetical protein